MTEMLAINIGQIALLNYYGVQPLTSHDALTSFLSILKHLRSKLKNVTNLGVKADTGQSRKCFKAKCMKRKIIVYLINETVD